jgi:RimJ/RimL family protein N-acetyltransferase
LQLQASIKEQQLKLQDAAVTAVLADGTEVELRPVGPDDKPLLEQGMAMLSPASRRLRFMSPIENLSRSQLAYLTEIDHESHLAWGVVVAGQPVAVARLVRLSGSPKVAEIAITVVDEWQARGIGRLLVRVLAEIGRSVGIERFVFEALPENEGIVRLLGSFGATHGFSEGVVAGSLEIASIEPAVFLTGNILELATAARRFGSPESVATQPSRPRIRRGTNSA